VLNGDFEKPNVNKGWNTYKDIPGWVSNGPIIEIGYGPIYNSAWKSQICELDSTQNYEITNGVSLNLDEINSISSSYSVVSTTINKKSAPAPVDVTIPVPKDTIIDVNGETLEVIEYSKGNVVVQSLIQKIEDYLVGFKTSVPTSKITEYEYVVKLYQFKPISVSLLKNCKYTEIAFLFSTTGPIPYAFVYFIQDNKSKDITYIGMLSSTNNNDPSFANSN
jgi:hypothetical protein